MTIDKDITTQLLVSEIDTKDPIEETDFTDIMERINAQYEGTMDAAAPPVGTVQTVNGHLHDGNGDGRGIARNRCGWFWIYSPPLTYSTQNAYGVSIATGHSPTYPSASNTTYLPDSFAVGEAFISPGTEQIRVEVMIRSSTVKPQGKVRIRNCTDTRTSNPDRGMTSGWVDVTNTGSTGKWYGKPGQTNAQDFIVPVERSTSSKIIELDIEVASVDENKSAITFYLYEAYAYEYKDQR